MCEISVASLDSGSPGVINAAAILIGDLFKFKARDVIPALNVLFQKLMQLLDRSEEIRDIHPFIVKALRQHNSYYSLDTSPFPSEPFHFLSLVGNERLHQHASAPL